MACSFGLTQQFAFILLGETNPTRPMHWNFSTRIMFLVICGLAAPKENYARSLSPTPTATPASALWYNGDFDGVTALGNEQNTSLGPGEYSRIYDDFNVIESDGWDVDSVFSNDLADTVITGATFEIRSGVTIGNPGTLIAGGVTATPIVTPTGRSGFGLTEFQVEITGLNIHLAPGAYWLYVTPIGDLTGRSLISTTSGANCIRSPCGDDANSFWDSNFFNKSLAPTIYDFSMGVNGKVSGGGNLEILSSFSRKTGRSGSFDVALPGVEDRSDNKLFTIGFTFNNSVTGADSASTDCGTVGSVSVDSTDAHTLLVTFYGQTCNTQTVTVSLTNVHDDQGNTLTSAETTVGLLIGDVNGNGGVGKHDVTNIQGQLGERTNSTNFRDDINADGRINNQDVQEALAHRGESLE